MKILIAEDENQKLAHIREWVCGFFKGADILIAKSVKAANEMLEDHSPEVMMLDMSLPTFEIGVGEPGGRPQGFGGVEVLRFADFLNLRVATFVITAFEGFENGSKTVDLAELRAKLADEHEGNFRGVVYYSGLGGDWGGELRRLVREAGFPGDDS